MSASVAWLIGHGGLLILAFVASAVVVLGCAGYAAARVVRSTAGWLRRRTAARVLASRGYSSRANLGHYFGDKMEQAVETRTTSTHEPASPLPPDRREAAKRDLEQADISDRLDAVWRRIAGEIGKPQRKIHPLGWTLVGVRNRLCAVAPSGCVDLYSEATCAWIPADQDMTRAARGVLGLST